MSESVRRYFTEAIDGGKTEVLSELFTKNCAIHRPELEINGIDDFTKFISGIPRVFSTFKTTIHDMFRMEDRVAVRLSHDVTVRDKLHSRLGVHETPGKIVSWDAIAIFRMEDSMIAEEWVIRDELGMLLNADVFSV